MKRLNGKLLVRRTALGYEAVLRMQADDGREVGYVGRCSRREARAIVFAHQPPQVGFSFKSLARKIAKTAKKVAKNRVFKLAMKAAKLLPAPIGTAAMAAEQAARVISHMARGSRKARAAWEDAAGRARRDPHGPVAVGLRLAMAASGPPRAPTLPAPRSPRPRVRIDTDRLARDIAAHIAHLAGAPATPEAAPAATPEATA